MDFDDIGIDDPINNTNIQELLSYTGDLDLNDILNDVDESAPQELDIDAFNKSLIAMGLDEYTDEQESPESANHTMADDIYNSPVEDMYSNNTNYNTSENNVDNTYTFQNNDIKQYSEEQKRSKLVDAIAPDSSDIDSFNFDIERESESKAQLIEQIHLIIEDLEDESIDVSRIPSVSMNTSLNELRRILQVLNTKNDFNQISGITDTIVLSAAELLGDVCNGKRTILGVRPDLRGFAPTAVTILRKARYTKSQLVSSVMTKMNIGPISKLVLSLCVHLFIHHKNQKNKMNTTLLSDSCTDSSWLDSSAELK